jgi:hypothetical protein
MASLLFPGDLLPALPPLGEQAQGRDQAIAEVGLVGDFCGWVFMSSPKCLIHSRLWQKGTTFVTIYCISKSWKGSRRAFGFTREPFMITARIRSSFLVVSRMSFNISYSLRMVFK